MVKTFSTYCTEFRATEANRRSGARRTFSTVGSMYCAATTVSTRPTFPFPWLSNSHRIVDRLANCSRHKCFRVYRMLGETARTGHQSVESGL
ncbi:unnamed protein product [Calypogeia fissa]